PKEPSVEWFRESLQAIVDGLKRGTTAQIGLSSLGPIGEDPGSSNTVQRTLNERIAELSGIIKETATSNQLSYIPFFETFRDQIAATPGKALTEFRFLPIYLDTFRFYVLRRSSDEIAQANGWRFHVDGVHLNRRGGMILANLVQEFLDS
ncbi:MAG TPA: SGNH/GDSL hydrolase family protein, partial [Candidatus Dormibacteraeota bacterium]|nr:SGNH/GDSL hydrolase family protein [Candidatus Dormibacteraeota bacterium]